MFNNVGGEIKAWAKFIVILVMVVFSVLGGALASTLFLSTASGFVVGAAVFAIPGYFVGRLTAIALYAFGQLVETVDNINKVLHTRNTVTSTGTVTQPTPPIPSAKAWTCRTCGERNDGGVKLCKKCNSPQ